MLQRWETNGANDTGMIGERGDRDPGVELPNAIFLCRPLRGLARSHRGIISLRRVMNLWERASPRRGRDRRTLSAEPTAH
ncbi:MAG TPA: hypothetical protein DGQ94_03135 [Pseudomonas sp.]|nr:hypothetical protein [Pseudomonas sp.]